MDVDLEALGRAVRELREHNQKTQEWLGVRAGYKSGAAVSISRLETGKARPRPERLKAIAEALGVTLDVLEQNAANPDSGADRRKERPKERELRVMGEVAKRTEDLDRAMTAFTEAQTRASRDFLMRLGEVVDRIDGAPPLDPKQVSEPQADRPAPPSLGGESLGIAATAAGGVAAAVVVGLLGSGKFSPGVARLSVISLGATTLRVLGDAAVALYLNNRQQQHERIQRLDEIETQLASTREGDLAFVKRLPRATDLLDYIAVHAGHAVGRWERGLGSAPVAWATLSVESRDRFREFVVIAQAVFAVQSEFEALSAVKAGEVAIKVRDLDSLLDIADETVRALV